MKLAISAAALILVFGTSASAYAGQDKGQGDHQQQAKPEHQQEAKPQHQQAKPAQQPHTQQQAKPAEQQHAQTQAKPEQQHAQQQAKPQQQQHAQQHAVSQQQSRASNQNHGNYAHGRISDAHYASNFGSGHRFHVSEGDYRDRRFAYGGYSFGFVDPWPMGWGYSDDVYVVYVDDGYYMYDPIHPGVRISLSIF